MDEFRINGYTLRDIRDKAKELIDYFFSFRMAELNKNALPSLEGNKIEITLKNTEEKIKCQYVSSNSDYIKVRTYRLDYLDAMTVKHVPTIHIFPLIDIKSISYIEE